MARTDAKVCAPIQSVVVKELVGVKLAPAGTTVTQLIEEYCGGMEDGHSFKAYLPGGASGGILPASLGDVPLTLILCKNTAVSSVRQQLWS